MPVRELDLPASFSSPYTSDLYLGRGLNVLNYDGAFQSPFKPDTVSIKSLAEVPANVSFNFSSVRTKEDQNRSIDVTVDASARFKAIPVSASFGHMSKVEISETRSMTILTAAYEPRPQMLLRKPEFTDEAAALLAQDPAEFARTYGDYYVAGYTCRSTLTAIAEHRAQTKSDLDTFTAHIEAGFAQHGKSKSESVPAIEDDKEEEEESEPVKKTEAKEKKSNKDAVTSAIVDKLVKSDSLESTIKKALPSISVGTSVSSLTKNDNVSTSIQIFNVGMKSAPKTANSLEEVLELYADWTKRLSPEPILVHLEHYKTIDMRAQSPGQNLLKDRDSHVRAMMKRMYKLYRTALASPYPEVNRKRQTVSDLLDEISDLDAAIEGYTAQVETLKLRLSAVELECKRMELRREFVQGVQALSSNQWGRHKSGWQNEIGDSNGVMRFGRTPDDVGVFDGDFAFIKGEIYADPKVFRREAKATYHDGTLSSHAEGNLVLIGYSVHDYWHDGTNGQWKINCANKDKVELAFEGKAWRGCNWGLTGYRVSSNLYFF